MPPAQRVELELDYDVDVRLELDPTLQILYDILRGF